MTPRVRKLDLDPDSPDNFKHISNFTLFSKIVEQSIITQLLQHLHSRQLFKLFQSGFQTGHTVLKQTSSKFIIISSTLQTLIPYPSSSSSTFLPPLTPMIPPYSSTVYSQSACVAQYSSGSSPTSLTVTILFLLTSLSPTLPLSAIGFPNIHSLNPSCL